MPDATNMVYNHTREQKNNIKIATDTLKKAEKELAKARLEFVQEENEEKRKALDEAIQKEKDAQIELEALKANAAAERSKKEREDIEKAWDEAGSKLTAALESGVKKFKANIDDTMNSFIQKQQSMAYGLTGTATDLKSVTQAFTKALGATGVVKQEKVYENLTNLIQEGIVFNAEQRAYLSTLADDLGMVFDPTEGSLTRLINLQRQDLSDERMAIEYSLKEFLNQNYQTSQYIKEGFANVSSSLIEAQSLMSANSAMQFEATVQQWLGSMSSVGASTTTVNNLAAALGQLGSGDLSLLSSDQFPLLAMAASNAGIPLGDILEDGLTSTTADALLRGVAQYASSIYSSSGSNVVLSELSKAFGISNVSDLVALSKVGNVTGTNGLSTNIGVLLSNMDNYQYTTTKLENTLANLIYSVATGVASDSNSYLTYRITDVLSTITGEIGSALPGTLGTVLKGASAIASIIGLFPGLMNSISGLGSTIQNGGSATAVYNALANGALASAAQSIGVAGLFTGASKTSSADTSGSMVYFNSDASDIAKGLKLSSSELTEQLFSGEETEKTLNDVYSLLQDFKTTSFGTYTKIVESDNTVTIGNDLSFVQDMIAFSAFNIQNIYALLVEYLKPENIESQKVYDLDNIEWASPFDWYSSAGSISLNR